MELTVQQWNDIGLAIGSLIIAGLIMVGICGVLGDFDE